MKPLSHDEYKIIQAAKRGSKYKNELMEFCSSGYPAAELDTLGTCPSNALSVYKATAKRNGIPVSLIMRNAKIYASYTGSDFHNPTKWYEQLAAAVCGGYEYPKDIEQTAIAIMGEALDERQRKIIMCRFDNLLTLEETGRLFNITRERARQIEAKSIRILRCPKYRRRWLIGDEEDARVSAQIEEEREARRKGMVNKIMASARIVDDENELVPIEDLDLSVRSYNSIRMFSDITTISQLVEKRLSIGDFAFEKWLLSLDHIGKKSAEEVMKKMDEYLEENKNVG